MEQKRQLFFSGSSPELAGCMADGESYAEVLANVQVFINEWIEIAQSLGRQVPEPKGKLIYT